MTHRDKLVKLAEIAGYFADHDGRVFRHRQCWPEDYVDWNPYENIAQAFEVLKGWGYSELTLFGTGKHACRIGAPLEDGKFFRMAIYEAKGDTEPEAICNAVLKARSEG